MAGSARRRRSADQKQDRLMIIAILTGAALCGAVIGQRLASTDAPAAHSSNLSGTVFADSGISNDPERRTNGGRDRSGPAASDPPAPGDLTPSPPSQTQITVYLVGAVVKPGIYRIASGSHLYEAVEIAGGLSENAARDHINLAQILQPNQMIRLPDLDEIQAGYPMSDAGWTIGLSGPAQASPEKININQATAAQLDQLPGIGPATAQAIVDYRNRSGPFARTEDLMKIPGIKISRFNRIKDLIVV